jgi:hypothetical protein
LPEFPHDIGPEFFSGRYSIGLWWWDLGRFPERFRGAFTGMGPETAVNQQPGQTEISQTQNEGILGLNSE